jgi:hypothetical protein
MQCKNAKNLRDYLIFCFYISLKETKCKQEAVLQLKVKIRNKNRKSVFLNQTYLKCILTNGSTVGNFFVPLAAVICTTVLLVVRF